MPVVSTGAESAFARLRFIRVMAHNLKIDKLCGITRAHYNKSMSPLVEWLLGGEPGSSARATGMLCLVKQLWRERKKVVGGAFEQALARGMGMKVHDDKKLEQLAASEKRLEDEIARLTTLRDSLGEPSFQMLARRTTAELLDLLSAFAKVPGANGEVRAIKLTDCSSKYERLSECVKQYRLDVDEQAIVDAAGSRVFRPRGAQAGEGAFEVDDVNGGDITAEGVRLYRVLWEGHDEHGWDAEWLTWLALCAGRRNVQPHASVERRISAVDRVEDEHAPVLRAQANAIESASTAAVELESWRDSRANGAFG
jgi:hypothetical protein